MPDLKTNTASMFRGGGFRREDEPEQHTNVASNFVMEIGDLANGFELADIILEHDYRIGEAHQGYIEPQSATALWNADGRLTIWCSSQGHFIDPRPHGGRSSGCRSAASRSCRWRSAAASAAKLYTTIEPVAALLSKKCGKPVKITLSRTDVFDAVGPTSACVHPLEDGRHERRSHHRRRCAAGVRGGRVPGFARRRRRDLHVHALRHPERPRRRLRRARKQAEGHRLPRARRPGGRLRRRDDDRRVLRAARHGPHRTSASSNATREGHAASPARFVEARLQRVPGSRKGVAPTGTRRSKGRTAAAASPPGSGATRRPGLRARHASTPTAPWAWSRARRTSAGRARRRDAARRDARHPRRGRAPPVGDTDSVGFTSLTGGSRTAFKQGAAAARGCEGRQAPARASAPRRSGNVTPDDITYDTACCATARTTAKTLTFKQIAARLNETGGPIDGSRQRRPGAVSAAPLRVHIADVEVDPDTGKVTGAALHGDRQDVGTAIHPSYVEGQMQGGAAQGIGWALNEEYLLQRRRPHAATPASSITACRRRSTCR